MMSKGKNTKLNTTNKKRDNLAWLMSGLFGILSGMFLVLGYQLEKFDHIDLSDRNSMLVMLAMMIVLAVDTKHVWNNYNARNRGQKFLGLIDLTKYSLDPSEEKTHEDSKSFFATWGVLIILNLPVLLAEFPGFFVYDAQDELNEVLTRSFSTHHPLLHVLLLGGVIAFVHKFSGSWNAGIFTYLFLQMLVITAIFAYVLGYMQKCGIGKKRKIAYTLYYGLFPTIVMFTLCSSKDGLFSALLLLLTVYLIQLLKNTEDFIKDRRKVTAFIITATLMPCFRHNGFYAYLVFVPFVLVYFIKRINKTLTALVILPVIFYLVFSNILGCISSEKTHHQEMLTVPIMQLARVYTYEKDSMTKEEINTLTSYIPEENLSLYTPRVSDMVKVGFNNELYEKDSASFYKLWAENLIKHPMTYVNAWLLTSYGFWYPAADINVYKGNSVFTFTYDESSYFGYEVEQPGERHSLIPVIDRLYRYLSIGSFFNDAPVISLVMLPGFAMLIFLFVFLYRLSVKNIKGVLPFLPMVLTYLTVLLGPTYLPRYVVYLWMCLPLIRISGANEMRKFDKEYYV